MTSSLTLAYVNDMDAAAFVKAFGGIAEHSPWVAEAAYASHPFKAVEAVVAAFASALFAAGEDRQLALIRAHPDLAGKAAIAGTLTRASFSEQAGAGLDTLTAGEFEAFTAFNARYLEKFGFPFILAVKGATKYIILKAFEDRLENDRALEFRTALEQIVKIMRFRLEDCIHD